MIGFEFVGYAVDDEGWDISVHEVTFGRNSYPEEKVEVFISQDGSEWKMVGVANNHDNNGVALLDISSSGGISWIKYVKLVDTTNSGLFGASADGFDLDAVDVRRQICERPEVSDVRVCKIDEGKNRLSEWDVQLLGEYMETVTVMPNGKPYSSSPLKEDDYVLVARGTYEYRGSSKLLTDPNYSQRLESDGYVGPYFPWINVNDFNSPYIGWLGVMVNDTATNWSDYLSGDHKYAVGYEDYSGVFSFTIRSITIQTMWAR